MRPPRGLSAEEAALWRRIAHSVTPLHPQPGPPLRDPAPPASAPTSPARLPAPARALAPPPAPPRPLTAHGLDQAWERKLARGPVSPDLTVDLHGLTLTVAHARLMGALAQARAGGARVILLIAGKPRPHGEHDARGERRGAIRAKLLDWLAASPHADAIAAVRPAQQRHGGHGAVYLVLRRAPRAQSASAAAAIRR